MDFLLFITGVVYLLRRRYSYVLTIIVFLASSYFELPINEDGFFRNFLIPHNIQDTGLLLYILLFIDIAKRKGLSRNHPLTRYVKFFYLFLLVSGVWDLTHGVGVPDVVKYWRLWLLLTIVYIAPHIESKTVMKSFRQTFNLSIACCLLILFQHFTNIDLISLRDLSEVGRGVKPPSYSIYAAALCLINFWHQGMLKRSVYFLILIAPTVLCLKMTYAITVVGIYMVYLFITTSWGAGRKIVLAMTLVTGIVCFLAYNDKFYDRMMTMTQEINTIDDNEVSGNFSYRILHTSERLNYISGSATTFVRGLGFVSEQNFKKQIFVVGLYDEEQDKIVQLDTGDIAWSRLFLRLGIVGTVIFLAFYLKIVSLYYVGRKQSIVNAYFFSMLFIFLLFTSLGNALITYNDFYIYPLLFLAAPSKRRAELIH